MTRYVLEWRELVAESATFGHRMACAKDSRSVQALVDGLGDRAWRREFRLVRAGCEVFICQREIEEWAGRRSSLPAASPMHIWRNDLRRGLAVDRFLHDLRREIRSAVAASVLRTADGDALLRVAEGLLLRPRL